MYLVHNKDFSLIFKKGSIYLDNQCVCSLADSFFLKKMSKIRILVRLLRLEPRCCSPIDESSFILAYRKRILIFSIKERKIVYEFSCRSGFSNPLNFCTLHDFGKPIVYWGDYGVNANREKINIYRYELSKKLEICYSFPSNSIKHIHNILYDKFNKRFFIFTGDFGEKVGIYESDIFFNEVKPYLVGNEKYRAVVGLVTEKGLLWATDSVMHDNYILYSPFGNKKDVSKICDLNGSVIYGMNINDGLLLSTTVEPYPSSKSKLLSLFDYRLGPGIKSKIVDVMYIGKDFSVKKICQFTKDILPMRLFQYGQVLFPYCSTNLKLRELICNPVSVKKWDGKDFTIKI